MKTLVSSARNIHLTKTKPDETVLDEQGKVNDRVEFVPAAEIVIVTTEPDYRLMQVPSQIEGGAPKIELVKGPKTEVFRFTVTKSSLRVLAETVGMTLAELTALDNDNEEAHEATGPKILVS
jgi:hypothetical protein